ncbi:Elongation factor Ts, mitochondrial [Rhodotorula toruloides]
MSRPSTSLVRTLLPRLASGLRPRQTTSRYFTTTHIARDEPVKVPVALISKVRSARPGTPLTLARSALAASNNDVSTALEWIAKQTAESGAKKAEKLAGREAQEGVVAVAVLADGTGGVGVRASLVEMRCETDFVARTDEFRELAEGIARSLAFFAEPTAEGGLVKHDVKADALLHTPVVPAPHKVDPTATAVDSPPETVKTSLAQIVSRLGENIHLSRASSISLNPSAPGSATFLASSYLHASKTPADAAATGVQSGALGGLLIARLAEGGDVDKTEVKGLLRALARQVVAMPTTSVRAAAASAPVESGEPSTALYEQSLITLAPSPKFEFEAGSKVGDVLKKWSEVRGVQGQGLEVVELARWELGAADEGEAA